MFYCPSCRQNLDASLKKNHNYQPFHKKWRDELIEKVVTRVSESRLFLKNVMRSKPGLEEPFNCPFCEEAIEQSQNKTIWFVSWYCDTATRRNILLHVRICAYIS